MKWIGIGITLIILSLSTTLWGQWLEETIYIPDSLSGITCPICLTYNSTNNKIYVGGEGNCVIVIDGATNEKIAKIPVGDYPYALVWNSTNNKVYCANYLSRNVTVIDGATNTVDTTITVGDYPRALVWNSTNNKVYCANEVSDNVTVIDGATNTVITTITVGDNPYALFWNSTNNKVYCANRASNNVTVIDGATNTVDTTITAGNYPCALVWNSTNNKVYCANAGSDNVTVIDGATNTVITTIDVGAEPLAFTWNSIQNRVYVANYAGSSVSVLRDVVGVEEEKPHWRDKMQSVKLMQNYPNPFNSFAVIRYSLSKPTRTTLKIHDMSGRVVKTLVNDLQNSGYYRVRWNLKDDRERKIANGVYFYRIEAGNFIATKKMLLIR